MSATNIRAPYGSSASNTNYECRKFTGGALGAETTSAVNALPDAHWSGKYVGMLAIGGNCHFAFSKNQAATIDTTVAATAAGATAQVGEPLIAGVKQYVRLPYWAAGSSLYFARESDAIGTVVYMWLSDEPGARTNP